MVSCAGLRVQGVSFKGSWRVCRKSWLDSIPRPLYPVPLVGQITCSSNRPWVLKELLLSTFVNIVLMLDQLWMRQCHSTRAIFNGNGQYGDSASLSLSLSLSSLSLSAYVYIHMRVYVYASTGQNFCFLPCRLLHTSYVKVQHPQVLRYPPLRWNS